MAQVIWTELALDDLDEIAEYIALDKPSASKKLVRKVFSSTKILKNFPNSGRKPPELEDFKYRELIVPPCRIFYRNEEDKIFILYIMRSERKLRQFLLSARNEIKS